MKRKLKSQRGASITFALLIFLVCAVVGSVVLGAGTAAAGRISELAKSDQRYYSVTSAARLFEEQFAGTNVTVTRERTYIITETTPIVYNTSTGIYTYGSTTTDDPSVSGYTGSTTINYSDSLTDSSGNEVSSPKDIFTYFADLYVNGTADKDAAWWEREPKISDLNTESLEKKLTASVADHAALDVEITATLKGNGVIWLEFVNKKADTDANYRPFTLRMILSADQHNSTLSESSSSAPVVGSDSKVVTTTVKDTKTTSITWRVHSLEILGGGGTV